MTRLLYQEDAYLRSARAEVIRCEAKGKQYEVVLSETVLYPEGGGQPSDAGTVGGHAVQGLFKHGDGTVVHLLQLPVDGSVIVELDWDRRFDHMQQHTAQHLITAVAADRFDLPTTAFHLGEVQSDIELDCAALSQETLLGIEGKVNELVRAGLPVSSRLIDSGEIRSDGVRTRGLPEDLSGPVRLVEIKGADLCTCGGTHVANTAQLQSVKLLHTEGMRGGTRLYFVAGNRLIGIMERMFERERVLTQLLSCGPEDHAASVEKLFKESREVSRESRSVRKELADHVAMKLSAEDRTASYHSSGGDMDFLRTVAAAIRVTRPDLLVLLTAGEGSGVFLLAGPDEKVSSLGPAVADALGGRGGGKGGVFQGKFSRGEGRKMAENLLERKD